MNLLHFLRGRSTRREFMGNTAGAAVAGSRLGALAGAADVAAGALPSGEASNMLSPLDHIMQIAGYEEVQRKDWNGKNILFHKLTSQKFKESRLEQISLLAKLHTEKAAFFAAGGGFEQLWNQAAENEGRKNGQYCSRGNRILQMPDGHQIDLWHEHSRKMIAWNKRCPETGLAICFDTKDSIRTLGDALRYMDTPKDLQALHVLTKELPLPLKALVEEYLLAPPSHVPSPALKDMFYEMARYPEMKMGELRRSIEDNSVCLRLDWQRPNAHKPETKKPSAPNESAPALAAWQNATHLDWTFIPGLDTRYEAMHKERYTRTTSGISVPHYANAYRVLDIVNNKAAREGQSLLLRADGETVPLPDGTSAFRLTIPAQLFNNHSYAREVGEQLKTDKKWGQRWQDARYWEEAARKIAHPSSKRR